LDTGNVIRPLILEQSSNDAEALASSLRNAGFAVRYRHVEDDEDLQNALDEQDWDILLAASEVGDYRALDALATIKRAGKDIPCIVFGPSADCDNTAAMLKAGAADYIDEEAQQHLLLAIEREIGNLRERRAHRHCKILYAARRHARLREPELSGHFWLCRPRGAGVGTGDGHDRRR